MGGGSEPRTPARGSYGAPALGWEGVYAIAEADSVQITDPQAARQRVPKARPLPLSLHSAQRMRPSCGEHIACARVACARVASTRGLTFMHGCSQQTSAPLPVFVRGFTLRETRAQAQTPTFLAPG